MRLLGWAARVDLRNNLPLAFPPKLKSDIKNPRFVAEHDLCGAGHGAIFGFPPAAVHSRSPGANPAVGQIVCAPWPNHRKQFIASAVETKGPNPSVCATETGSLAAG